VSNEGAAEEMFGSARYTRTVTFYRLPGPLSREFQLHIVKPRSPASGWGRKYSSGNSNMSRTTPKAPRMRSSCFPINSAFATLRPHCLAHRSLWPARDRACWLTEFLRSWVAVVYNAHDICMQERQLEREKEDTND